MLDNVLPADACDAVIADFPTPDNPVWKQYKSRYEGKLETQGEGHISAFTSLFLYQLNSAPFLRFLEELTGIQVLYRIRISSAAACIKSLVAVSSAFTRTFIGTPSSRWNAGSTSSSI